MTDYGPVKRFITTAGFDILLADAARKAVSQTEKDYVAGWHQKFAKTKGDRGEMRIYRKEYEQLRKLADGPEKKYE